MNLKKLSEYQDWN